MFDLVSSGLYSFHLAEVIEEGSGTSFGVTAKRRGRGRRSIRGGLFRSGIPAADPGLWGSPLFACGFWASPGCLAGGVWAGRRQRVPSSGRESYCCTVGAEREREQRHFNLTYFGLCSCWTSQVLAWNQTQPLYTVMIRDCDLQALQMKTQHMLKVYLFFWPCVVDYICCFWIASLMGLFFCTIRYPNITVLFHQCSYH